ncbi:MAG: hypothetical protein CM15mP120_10710 [Pseudomonadota bacterium]|nr:MAG: hypothetical protein CM15mP120_10710 [Pseudomonadota bacterium]
MAKLRFGLVGGGYGAFIGQVHRMAAELDGLAELVAGHFLQIQSVPRGGCRFYKLPGPRSYPSFEAMFAGEQQFPGPQQRMDFVIIATPNHMHTPSPVRH